ncbi:hypothetical protein [Desulfurobacterium sp.]
MKRLKLKELFKKAWEIADSIGRDSAVNVVESEVDELEKIFSLLLLGELVGYPGSPSHIYIQMLPVSEKLLITLGNAVTEAEDPLGKLFSVFDID